MIGAGRPLTSPGHRLDAGPKTSPVLLQLGGPLAARTGSAADPSLLQDVFFRIGGATAGSATDSLVVNSSDVILDDIWAWRADHGAGVGWTGNIADTGLIVNGNDVTAYGLAVEHYQKNEVIWNGQGGEDIPPACRWVAAAPLTPLPAGAAGPSLTCENGHRYR